MIEWLSHPCPWWAPQAVYSQKAVRFRYSQIHTAPQKFAIASYTANPQILKINWNFVGKWIRFISNSTCFISFHISFIFISYLWCLEWRDPVTLWSYHARADRKRWLSSCRCCWDRKNESCQFSDDRKFPCVNRPPFQHFNVHFARLCCFEVILNL